MRIDQIVKVMAGDRENRLAVELRIVQAVEQMDAARPRGRQADTQLAGVFGVGAGHEGRRFLVAHLDEADSSCRLRSASMMPLMPSPGRPKITSTPHSAIVSIKISAAVCFMS